MSQPRKATSSFSGGTRAAKKQKPPPEQPQPPSGPQSGPQSGPDQREPSAFTLALADLLRARNLDVPAGLLAAPPEAYAGQSEAVVQTMARLKDADLADRASRVALWEQRQTERAEQAWESSPLIKELRRRGLGEPARPERVVVVAFSLKKPLAEWTDDDLVDAAGEWARLVGGAGRG